MRLDQSAASSTARVSAAAGRHDEARVAILVAQRWLTVRAKQIADNRARGQTVTDEELKALSRSLPSKADDLDREADRLQEQAADRSNRPT